MLLRLQGYQLNVKYKQGYKMHIADFLSRSALPLTRAQNNGTNENTSFVFANNDYDVVCALFESVNFSEDLAVTTKRNNQIETCTAKRDCPKLIPFETKLLLKMVFHSKAKLLSFLLQ